MPYKADEPSVSWISDSADLKAVVRDFDSVVGIDSEFKRTNTFYPIPALYQVASGKDVFLLDPLTITDWSALVDFLEDEDVIQQITPRNTTEPLEKSLFKPYSKSFA